MIGVDWRIHKALEAAEAFSDVIREPIDVEDLV
jgi:hypothetical protein